MCRSVSGACTTVGVSRAIVGSNDITKRLATIAPNVGGLRITDILRRWVSVGVDGIRTCAGAAVASASDVSEADLMGSIIKCAAGCAGTPAWIWACVALQIHYGHVYISFSSVVCGL